MNLNCKRCGYKWNTRSHIVPLVCPECKSRIYDKEPDVPNYLKNSCQHIINMTKNLDYDVVAPRLLQLVIVSFCEAEKTFIDNGENVKAAGKAASVIDNVKDLCIQKILPEEMHNICNRIIENYFITSIPIKAHQFTEKDLSSFVLKKWDSIGLNNFVFKQTEYKCEGLGIIDILAEEKISGRHAIIELKKGKKDGYKQLHTYATIFEDPILINISTQEIQHKKKGIIYIVVNEAEIIGRSPILALTTTPKGALK